MIFSSSVFLFYFLPITLLAYKLVKDKYKNILLTFVSLFFYAWGEPVLVFVMLFLIFSNYMFGLLINKYNKYKKVFLIISIIINLSFLIYYKYINFIIENFNHLLFKFELATITQTHIILPIGISFFTFQAMSYTIDVYRDREKYQNRIMNVALYISLFPQLIAGPIVRYDHIANQINNHEVTMDKFYRGLQRFIIGLAKKVLIANNVAIVADKVFESSNLSSGVAWLGIVAYTLQIYFDFSGYSDMAIGLGKLFGFDFPENFNTPYISQSIREFWRRWHISLSSWFRDYVYIPLGGNKKGEFRRYINLSIVFLLTGIWHGANWTFILWGILHGLFIVLERIVENKENGFKIPRFLRHIYTMFIVMIGWVFFRSPDIKYAINYLRSMFSLNFPNELWDVMLIADKENILMLVIGIVVSLGAGKILLKKTMSFIEKKPQFIITQDVTVFILLILSILKIISGSYNPFIYFQF